MTNQVPFQLRMNKNLSDLNPVLVGESLCTYGDHIFPLIAGENYLLHFVRCGHGTFTYKGQVYPLRSGQILVSCPGDTGQLCPAENSRWALRWIGFGGTLAHRFSELPLIVDAPPGTFEMLCDLNRSPYMLEYKLASELMFLYSALLTPQKQKLMVDPVEWVKEYVAKNYMNHIAVPELAKKVGLDPDYLTRKFKKKLNMSIQQYILHTRITNSRIFLAQGYSVKETSNMCGFNDTSSFSRAFKKYDGADRTPSQWQAFYIEFHRKRTHSDDPL